MYTNMIQGWYTTLDVPGDVKPRREGRRGLLSPLVRAVFQYVLHLAVQNLAQRVQGGGGNGLAVLHAVDGVRVDALLVD